MPNKTKEERIADQIEDCEQEIKDYQQEIDNAEENICNLEIKISELRSGKKEPEPPSLCHGCQEEIDKEVDQELCYTCYHKIDQLIKEHSFTPKTIAQGDDKLEETIKKYFKDELK